MQIFKKILPVIAIVASFSSHAAFLSVEDWHETSDAFGGLKQSHYSQDVFYAVGQSNLLWFKDTYEIPDGFRVASYEEIKDIYKNSNYNPSEYIYYSQGGWNGYVWNGVKRNLFLYSDSLDNNFSAHVGTLDSPGNSSWLTASLYENHVKNWAGFVLIKDESATGGLYSFSTGYYKASDVPLPSGVLLFGLGGLFLLRKKRA